LNMKPVRHILHVDMDAFYASVEQLDNPQLRGRPVVVGSLAEQRGVVAAASYEARRFGIRSAMPMSRAMRQCKELVIMPVRMKRYKEISRRIHAIFHEFTPQVEPLSIDEAFLDITGCEKLFGPARQIAVMIKKRIREQTGLTASVGLAPNKFLAKLASDLEKPEGLVVITDENKQAILDPLPVRRIWGIGEAAAKRLQEFGIKTIYDLRSYPAVHLAAITDQAGKIQQLANGIDDRPVIVEERPKSFSGEETFAKDISSLERLRDILSSQIEEVTAILRRHNMFARTLTLKFRYADFETITRSRTLGRASQATDTFRDAAFELFEAWQKTRKGPIRLLGFGVSNLSETPPAKELFEDGPEEKRIRLDTALDKIRNKFGDSSLHRG
jgi:DNA polymerase IV